jgi:asparagine synthase (glutamine-hydrolysing)
MCGINGIISADYDPAYIFGNFNLSAHRGPDKTTFIDTKDFSLCFHLLAISDVKHAMIQPYTIRLNDGRVIYIMCNGEIFNHKKLRKTIIENHYYDGNGNDYVFQSNSDCEVLIPLYLNLGMEFLNMLDADFSIAIYDITETKKTLYLTRDRIGTRELYYVSTHHGPTFIENQISTFAFSSEMRSVQFCGEVHEFPPSTVMEIDFTNRYLIKIKEWKYYDLGNIIELGPEIHEEEIKQNIKRLLIEAVDLRLSYEVIQAFLLSGGLDSSLIASIGLEILNKKNYDKLIIFGTIGIENLNSPDIYNAKKLFEYFKNKYPNLKMIHHVFYVSEKECLETFEFIGNVIATYCVTTSRAGVLQYLVTKKLKQLYPNLRVLLTGEYFDECWGSYKFFKLAPSAHESKKTSIKYMRENYRYDLKRLACNSSYFGIEARPPASSFKLIDYICSIPSSYTHCIDRPEKLLLRYSFEGYLPDFILFRGKNAFSDSVSNIQRSFYQIIDEYVNEKISDEYFEMKRQYYKNLYGDKFINHPTKEFLFLFERFNYYYPNQPQILDKIWMPSFCDASITNPSARVIEIENVENV